MSVLAAALAEARAAGCKVTSRTIHPTFMRDANGYVIGFAPTDTLYRVEGEPGPWEVTMRLARFKRERDGVWVMVVRA